MVQVGSEFPDKARNLVSVASTAMATDASNGRTKGHEEDRDLPNEQGSLVLSRFRTNISMNQTHSSLVLNASTFIRHWVCPSLEAISVVRFFKSSNFSAANARVLLYACWTHLHILIVRFLSTNTRRRVFLLLRTQFTWR